MISWNWCSSAASQQSDNSFQTFSPMASPPRQVSHSVCARSPSIFRFIFLLYAWVVYVPR